MMQLAHFLSLFFVVLNSLGLYPTPMQGASAASPVKVRCSVQLVERWENMRQGWRGTFSIACRLKLKKNMR